MSDLLSAKQKVQQGIEWRGSISVSIDDEEHEFSIRQLRDHELREVLDLIDRDELEGFHDDLPEDLVEEYRELQQAEDRTEDEEERMEALRDQLTEESGSALEVLSADTFEGLQKTAIYAIEPDKEDLQTVFREHASEIEREYGHRVKTPEDVKEYVDDEIEDMIRNATGFTSVNIGIQCLLETVGEEGN